MLCYNAVLVCMALQLLSCDAQTLEERFEAMSDRVAKLERKNKRRKQDIKTLGKENKRQDQTMIILGNTTKQLQTQLDGVKDQTLRSQNASFSARRYSSVRLTEGVVQFATVIANPGRHYQVNESTFICPVSGMYFFAFTLYSDTLQRGTDYWNMASELQLNGTRVVSAYTSTGDPGFGDTRMMGTSAVVECHAGGRVRVYIDSDGGTGVSGFDKSVFSGFLL